MSNIEETWADFDETQMFPHRVLESSFNGMHALQFTEGKFSDIIFSYGKVTLPEPDGDTANLAFEYEVHDSAGVDYDKSEFEHYLGQFLVQLIIYGIKKNDLSYTGGIDENRDSDFSESDI